MTETEFKAAYVAAKAELLESGINKLRIAVFDAGARLHAVVLDVNVPAPAAVSAAGRIYELLYRGIEVADFGARLTELEKSVAEEK
jgi:hypothetical protein